MDPLRKTSPEWNPAANPDSRREGLGTGHPSRIGSRALIRMTDQG
jgi:hypothetical protein